MQTVRPVTNRIKIDLEAWKSLGAEKFGADKRMWKFKCPACGGVQTLQDFMDNGVKDPDGKFYFSCIGRWVQSRGCDWTLGGLLQIHNTEVVTEDGSIVPVFDFA